MKYIIRDLRGLISKYRFCRRTFLWATRATKRTSNLIESHHRCIIRIRCTIRMRRRTGSAASCYCANWAKLASGSAVRNATRSARDCISCNRSTIYWSICRRRRRPRTSRIIRRMLLPPPNLIRTSALMVRLKHLLSCFLSLVRNYSSA